MKPELAATQQASHIDPPILTVRDLSVRFGALVAVNTSTSSPSAGISPR
jgi:hypothetical protein